MAKVTRMVKVCMRCIKGGCAADSAETSVTILPNSVNRPRCLDLAFRSASKHHGASKSHIQAVSLRELRLCSAFADFFLRLSIRR